MILDCIVQNWPSPEAAYDFAEKAVHQPSGLIGPSTTLHRFGAMVGDPRPRPALREDFVNNSIVVFMV